MKVSWQQYISLACFSYETIVKYEYAPKRFFCHQGTKAQSFTKDESLKNRLLVTPWCLCVLVALLFFELFGVTSVLKF